MLQICRNKIRSLPQQLMRCTKLRRLYLNTNQISLYGLPRGIYNLEKLEVFSAADNILETIPDALCRLGSLKVLNLNKNKLLTLPEAIHFLQLKVCLKYRMSHLSYKVKRKFVILFHK